MSTPPLHTQPRPSPPTILQKPTPLRHGQTITTTTRRANPRIITRHPPGWVFLLEAVEAVGAYVYLKIIVNL